jgi:hypothetical protein
MALQFLLQAVEQLQVKAGILAAAKAPEVPEVLLVADQLTLLVLQVQVVIMRSVVQEVLELDPAEELEVQETLVLELIMEVEEPVEAIPLEELVQKVQY